MWLELLEIPQANRRNKCSKDFFYLPICPPVSLIVRPDLQQFFSGQSVSLSCEDGQTADGWTVKRTKGTLTETCGASGSDFGVFKDSSCVLDLLSSYTGVYWCETSAGQRSDHINITVNQKEGMAFCLVWGLQLPGLCACIVGTKTIDFSHSFEHLTQRL